MFLSEDSPVDEDERGSTENERVIYVLV